MPFISSASRFTLAVALGTLLLAVVLVGCESKSGNEAASTVENYLKALVAKDSARLASLSCSDWEENAALELESVAAVTVSLKDVTCQVTGQEGENNLVSCTGALLANYNGEDQEINLADRIYLTRQEGGEWLMCGYR
jgi:hypothetical protein